ncbi:MAG TPA: hypothetical protein VGO69_10685 [Pyrinomonadaceae bacterium]|nr:hypothetical protein [Pyrinomonadaceae bacterium]
MAEKETMNRADYADAKEGLLSNDRNQSKACPMNQPGATEDTIKPHEFVPQNGRGALIKYEAVQFYARLISVFDGMPVD